MTEVSAALVSSLEEAFPGTACVVAWVAEDRLGVRIASLSPGAMRASLAANQVVLAEAADLACTSCAAVALATMARLHERLPAFGPGFGHDVRALYAAPLLAHDGDECLGAAMLLFPDEREIDEERAALIASQVEQAALALQRARAYEREHDVAVRLQASLLPDRLPTIGGLDLAGRYQAGTAALMVGGDWYDVVRRPDGLVHLIVGDVAGRGVGAATVMGQIADGVPRLLVRQREPWATSCAT